METKCARLKSLQEVKKDRLKQLANPYAGFNSLMSCEYEEAYKIGVQKDIDEIEKLIERHPEYCQICKQ